MEIILIFIASILGIQLLANVYFYFDRKTVQSKYREDDVAYQKSQLDVKDQVDFITKRFNEAVDNNKVLQSTCAYYYTELLKLGWNPREAEEKQKKQNEAIIESTLKELKRDKNGRFVKSESNNDYD